MDLVTFINGDGICGYDSIMHQITLTGSQGNAFSISSISLYLLISGDCRQLEDIKISSSGIEFVDQNISMTSSNYDVYVINKIVGYLR